jgi:hypothetical protein
MTTNMLQKVTMSSSSLRYKLSSVAMKFALYSLIVVLYSSFADFALAGTYLLGDRVVGSRFLEAFSFQAIGDPTYGTVFVFRCEPALFLYLTCFTYRIGTMSMRALR